MENDLIRRSDVEAAIIEDSYGRYCPPEPVDPYSWALSFVKDAPAVDAVEICRCKDCRYGTIDQYSAGEYVVVCDAPKKRPGTDVYALDWYCPMGQRREGGDACT